MLGLSKLKNYFIIFFLCFAGLAKASSSCESVLGDKVVGTPSKFFEVYKLKPSTIDSVLKGDNPPGWLDYNWIKNLKNATLESKLTAEEAWQIRKYLAPLFSRFNSKTKQEKEQFLDIAYRFFEMLQLIGQKRGFRAFKWDYLKEAPIDSELIIQAEKTVALNVKRMRENYHLTGSKNPEELIEKIFNLSTEGKRALDLVTEQLIVTIRRPNRARFWIPIAGFQNQRVTGTSNGSFNHGRRDQVESNLTYQEFGEYQKLSSRYKPQYGEARPDFSLETIQFKTGAHHYGDDFWIVKNELLDARATWTPRDSFGQSIAPGGNQTQWDQLFIPWLHRELMAPYLIENLKMNLFYSGGIPAELGLSGNRGSSYFEVQLWGPITLKDISGFAFGSEPPTAEFVKILQQYGIKIYDARTTPVVLYQVGEL
jgi:hypothetical protein